MSQCESDYVVRNLRQQEHIEDLQARVALLEEALRYVDSSLDDDEVYLAGLIARTLSTQPSEYLKQVRNQVREECAVIAQRDYQRMKDTETEQMLVSALKFSKSVLKQ